MSRLTTIIFTGVSGGGKTTALRAVEDLGFYCVDNLPLPLLADLVELMSQTDAVKRVGLVVDARLPQYIEGYAVASVALNQKGHRVEVVYLDAGDEVLVRRFSQTRRRHPLSMTDVRAGLERERELLTPLRAQASIHIDTSDLTPHQLKSVVQDRYEVDGAQLVVTLLSFGFRYGLPTHADVVLDVRFLDNPFFVDRLRERTGLEREVSDYVFASDDAAQFADRAQSMLEFLLPRYEAEGKVYLTIGIGCTGGRHRSVAMVEELAKRLRDQRPLVNVRHRDVER
jgi:UPF0042 nucleotide-binding protein